MRFCVKICLMNSKPVEKGKIKLLDVVALTEDVPKHNLRRGEIGTVVEILSDGEAFEVEFSDDNGQMSKCLSFFSSQLTLIQNEPINVNQNRQANDAIQGYYYQLCHTVNAWLDLADNDVLYVEFAEDFDIDSDGTFVATQVKHTQHPITLRSKQVINAISNYWKLRNDNRNRSVKFRLLTKSKIGKEQGDPFGTDKPGLELWSRCSGDEAVIKKISHFLQNDGKISSDVNDFLKKAEPKEIYEQLIEPVFWDTGCKDTSSVEEEINEKLIYHGEENKIKASYAKKVFAPLLTKAFVVATQKQNRKLTKASFLEIFEEQTTVRVPIQQYIRSQQPIDLKPILDHFKETLGEELSIFTIQSQSHIQTEIPPLNFDVTQRTGLFTDIQAKLESEDMVVIQGGTGKGKTTLAKLTANAISSKWFWLNFTNKDPSLIVQHLQQLAIAVSHESSQVNIVLDDLNLQPQQLREYAESLCAVVNKVRKNGVKLLITSQHKPPNNLIRDFGLSSSLTINVPNFIESEIEQFALQMGCPTNDLETWVTFIQAHTGGHPRLVHARLAQLQKEGWKQPDSIESMLKTPTEVVEEREAARQLLINLPENQREFLYRLSLMFIGFRKDYALNIAEIPEPISHPGDVFSQLVGPWIDQIDEIYYTISPLLSKAADQVWTESKIKDLHAHIANAILKTKEKTKKLTAIDAWAVLTHSMVGQNKGALISVIYALMTAPKDDWENICQEFSWIPYVKTKPPEELFPGDTFVNQMFRSLQFDIAVEVEPEFAPKILEIWDEETKPYKLHQSYPLFRLMLATEALKYNQVQLSAKKLVSYLKEMIDIKNTDNEVWKSHYNSMEQLKENNINESGYFSFLFSFIYMRTYIDISFLNELIDTLDELDSKTRTLLLADFENDNIEPELLINGVWLAESKIENPDWTRCLKIFDKVIDKTLEWGYPHIAASSAKGKAIIYDEYLNTPDTAHEVLQDITSKVGSLLVIEEERALVYFHHEHYREALNIYERILPEWNPPSKQLNIGPLEEYRRAAICAAHLDDWKKAAIFLEEGAKKTQEIENTDKYIGLYADAGFAQFKAGNMLESIKLLTLALQKFEKLPQDNTDLKYYAMKKRIAGSIGWIAYHEDEKFTSGSIEPSVAFCSNQEANEEVLNLPDSPIELIWLALARIECKFGNGITALRHSIEIAEKTTDPNFHGSLALLELQYDFKNKIVEDLPQRIHQIANVCDLFQKRSQREKLNPVDRAKLSNFASLETITVILVSGLFTQLQTNRNMHEILAIWRRNSSELPIKDTIFNALDLIDSMLSGDYNQALTEMKTQDAKIEKRLIGTLNVIQNQETSPEDLFIAHIYITTYFIGSPWEDYIVQNLVDLLSAQWLEKIKSGAMLQMNVNILQEIEQTCNSSETGNKKIGQILLAAYQVVSTMITSDTFQLLQSWTADP